MNTGLLIGGGVLLWLWKGGKLGALTHSTNTPGTTTTTAGGLTTTTYPDGSTRTTDASGRVVAVTPATRASTATSPVSTALMNSLVAAGISAGGAVLIAGIKALAAPATATPIATALTDAQIAMIRDAGLTTDTSAFLTPAQADALTSLATSAGKATVGELIDAVLATPTPAVLWTSPDAGLVASGGSTAGLPTGEVLTPIPVETLTAAQQDTIYAMMQQQPTADISVVAWRPDGAATLATGETILPDGLVVVADPSVEILSFEPITDTSGLFNFASNNLGVGIADIATAANVAAVDLTGMTVAELFNVITPIAAVAGVGLSLALNDSHTQAGQTSNAWTLLATSGGLITAALGVGPWGGLVALPLIIGSIFGRNRPSVPDPWWDAAWGAGYIGELSRLSWDVFNHARTLPDFEAELGLTGTALDAAMHDAFTFETAIAKKNNIPLFAVGDFNPAGLMIGDTDMWSLIAGLYQAAVQKASVASAAQIAAETIIAQQVATGVNTAGEPIATAGVILPPDAWVQTYSTVSTGDTTVVVPDPPPATTTAVIDPATIPPTDAQTQVWLDSIAYTGGGG